MPLPNFSWGHRTTPGNCRKLHSRSGSATYTARCACRLQPGRGLSLLFPGINFFKSSFPFKVQKLPEYIIHQFWVKVVIIAETILSKEYALTISADFLPILDTLSRSASNVSRKVIHFLISPGWKTIPFTPSLTKSGAQPALLDTITALEQAMASLMARPQVSPGPSEGKMKTSPTR